MVTTDVDTFKREVMRYAETVYRKLPVDRVFLFGRFADRLAEGRVDAEVEIAFFLRDFHGKTRLQIDIELHAMKYDFDAYIMPLAFPTSEINNGNPLVNEIVGFGTDILTDLRQNTERND